MEQVIKRLGQRIRQLRLERGFKSQEKFAAYCGVDRTFMGHLETGRRDFRLSTIIRVADALDVPVADLFLETGSNASEQGRPLTRKLGTGLERKRVLETAATLEAAARTLKALAGVELPQRRSKRKDGNT